jgi:uncharacterized membrane protein
MDPHEFTDRIEDMRVVVAIRAAEAKGRGEIRVHVTQEAVGDPQEAAIEVFETLGMTATAERNGVLIYVAPRTQSFAVIGDRGVHEKCGPAFWNEVAESMRDEFRAGRFTEGIVKGVERAGELMAELFPREGTRADVNELPDTISRD